ncbi:uncharacterized protein FYW23_015576 [Sylvia borin]
MFFSGFIMSFGVKACQYFWSPGVFEVLIPLWYLGLFPYLEKALVLLLIRSFWGRGALTRILIGLGLLVMLYRRAVKMLESVPGVYSSLLWWCIQFVRGEAGGEFFQPLSSLFSFEFFTSLLENVQFPLSVKETIFLAFNLVSFVYTVCSLYKMKAEISKGANETSDLGVKPTKGNLEWSGKWEDMGQILKEFSDPIVWDFPSEQIQNPAEVAKYLKEKCRGNTKEKRIIAGSWALACVYRTLLDTEGQQIEEREQGDKLVTIPVTQAAADILGSRPTAKPDRESKTLAVAGAKRARKTDRPVEDDDDEGEGPSRPPEDTQSEAGQTDIKSEAELTDTRLAAGPTGLRSNAQPAGTRSGATIDSFSLKDLRGLRKDYTRRPDESIISWLVCLWDAAGEATILDGTEARHLGSLSHDPVIDQGMMREATPCSLWERVLGSVAQRYLCADDLYMQQTQWKTIEQGIQRLREMAVAEIIFSDDLNTKNPDLVPCTPVMWRKLVRLGPSEYASALAIMKREETYEIVLDMARKLRAYADAVHAPTHARIAAVETRLQKLEDKLEENHKKLQEEIREDFLQISAVQIRGPGVQRGRTSVGERRRTPRTELWVCLREAGEDMRRWDGKPTAALAQRVCKLKEGRVQRECPTKQRAAPVVCNRDVRYGDDDDDPLEGTSRTYVQGKKDNQA